jgi:tripeptide aminopeptidase
MTKQRQATAVRRNDPLDKSQALDLVRELLIIPGGSGKEAAVIDFIRRQLLAIGVPRAAIKTDQAHRRSPNQGEVGNLIVKLPGTFRGPRRLFVAHTDTVPICVGSEPVKKGRRFRSANPEKAIGADDRSGTAVLLSTISALYRGKLDHPPVTFLWTVQEESGLQGAQYVQLGLLGKPQLAFNFDGGSPTKLTLGATGGYRLTIDIRGIASHAGFAPEQGVSAIAIAARAITDLVDRGWHGEIRKGNDLGTSNVGVIQGGAATNVVTNHVSIRAEARSHNPRFRKRIVAEIHKAFEQAARKTRNVEGKCGKVRFDGRLDYESFQLPLDEPSVVAAAEAVRAEGHKPEYRVANGGLDANWLTAHGIPTVSLGCGQKNIHTVKEELDLDEYHLARRIALRLATVGTELQTVKQ